MAIDWSERGEKRGLAVEGINHDSKIIEAFLSAGERKGNQYCQNWRSKIVIKGAGSSTNVTNELKIHNNDPDSKHYGMIWGLIDRDWNSPNEIKQLKKDYPQLLILPRVMIENYLIDPDELIPLLPSLKNGQADDLKTRIEAELDRWVQNGAMWQVLHDEGADKFCSRKGDNYPGALRNSPITEETEITKILGEFQTKLDPKMILPVYRDKVSKFQGLPKEVRYQQCIYGKKFFNQVVVKALNDIITLKPKQKSGTWHLELVQQEPKPDDCPADLIPLLQKLLS